MEKYRAIPKGYMRIGEMAKKAGVTVRTLKYYDEEGLLLPSAESDGGFRLYSDKDMVRLIQILMMKQLGLPLSEIKKRLTQLDTPADVRGMITEQAAQVRKKIDALTESLDAMEALSAEIAQMETVNFKKYADILLNLQVKNDRYRLIKHFDDETMDMFRERIGREKTALMAATLNDLYKEASGLLAEAPESERGQAFAGKLWQTVVELSGGDQEMMRKLNEQMDKASSLEKENNEERAAVYNFMMRASEVYLSGQDSKGKLRDLYEEAVGLLAESPGSERGQAFAGKLWQALVELSGGDPEKMRKMNEQSEKASGLRQGSNEIRAVRNFMERALEIYHTNQGLKGDM
ncbi:MAG: MerR family transcriptional regulator [Defluviitaleaceae bacterium]|nr:MerR family transcriptional regulator [Defluviitaleaceae bacterium]